MIAFKVNNVPTLFIKAFTARDVQTIMDFVRDAGSRSKSASNTVLFIDNPITAHTVEAVEKLTLEGYRVCYRDHHGIDGEPANDRDRQVKAAANKLKQDLGDDCVITVRRLHPACSTLVEVGEFQDAVAIIADPDADGLTAAMKAAGICYPELDEDAALLDGEPHLQVTGSAISQLLAKGVATLPSFDPKEPLRREQAQQALFADWVKAVQQDKQAQARLQDVVVAYDAAVRVAETLASNAVEIVSGVMLADCTEQPVFDSGTLIHLLEQRPGCRITVQKKGLGPIAAVHGIQYSLAVAKIYQGEINLQKILPADTKSGPQFGVITNVSFLLHVSEEVFGDSVLSQLRDLSDKWKAPQL
ncbi:MAG: hypothetical protein K2Y22_15775 [Candidatus Obscuribacterales bacterium]|nr:hypothetical protein [Candidatus Obscuribacterales bacterium]